jgi:hypothetical protein
MTLYRLNIQFIQFTREALHKEICRASFVSDSCDPLDQVRYLGSYLADSEMGAKTIIVEHPYVDRHFLEEYSNYYATTLRPPPPKATRLHFFKRKITQRQFTYLLRRAANGGFESVSETLNKDYLGFSVIRPLPDAPIGRTVLATFSSVTDRCYTLPPHPYRVHLCGIKLRVFGVPFQQQEQAVGACATTAVWSALAQVMRHDGGRAPTPFAVTEAATRHWVSDRVYPAAAGLKDEQILEAIRQFGYAPLHFDPLEQTELFMLAVKCYLRSGIPVILKIHYPDEPHEAHAVTAIGFREGSTAIEYRESKRKSYGIRAKGLNRIYIHDDRLGPYARAEWRVDDNGFIQLKYLPHEGGYDEFGHEAELKSAMVPVYPKIRLSAQDLIAFAGELLPTFRFIVGQEKRGQLLVDLRFCLAGDCLALLYNSDIPADRFANFARQAVLSRYVGLISFFVGDDLLAHVLCDSTDMRRNAPASAPLLSIIPRYEQHVDALREYRPDALIL